MFLIFDTETTGLPRDYNAPPSDSDNWPRLVQIAWQLHDSRGKLIHHASIIIKPSGFTIPFNAVNIHGISTERAMQEGRELLEVLQEFEEVKKQATYICGHNILFDVNIVAAELLRCNLENTISTFPIIDTKSDETTAFCAIPGGRGGKFKWPTLTELYNKLFGIGFEEAHNAAFDVQATARVFFEIVKRGVTPVKEISKALLAEIDYEDVDLSELLATEKKLKQKEKGGNTSVLSGVPNSMPALLKAYRIQEKARAVGFDWEQPEQVFEKVKEEINELNAEVGKENNLTKIEDEFGDVLFALINYGRFIKVNPEDALERTNKKFIKRFNYMEQKIKEQGKQLADCTLAEMDVYWNEAKKL